MFTTERSNSATSYGARPCFLGFVAICAVNSNTKFQNNRMLVLVFIALQKLVTYVILGPTCPIFSIDFWTNYGKKAQKVRFFSCIFRGLCNFEEGARVLRNKNFDE
mgnify:CR=1 FL=1